MKKLLFIMGFAILLIPTLLMSADIIVVDPHEETHAGHSGNGEIQSVYDGGDNFVGYAFATTQGYMMLTLPSNNSHILDYDNYAGTTLSCIEITLFGQLAGAEQSAINTNHLALPYNGGTICELGGSIEMLPAKHSNF